MATRPKPLYTEEEYLTLERQTEEKHEYYAGEIFAMGGASRRHNLVVTNLIAELRQRLKDRPSEVYPSDMRVKVGPTGPYTYPDVVVVCGEPRFDDDVFDTLLNPTVLIEVLSPSTEGYDRGKKFEHYRKPESLQEYVLVSTDAPHVECFARHQQNRWLLSEADGLDGESRLSALDATLKLAEVYDKVVFDTDNENEGPRASENDG